MDTRNRAIRRGVSVLAGWADAAIGMALCVVLSGCAGSGEASFAGSQTYFGTPQTMGGGTTRSFVMMDANNRPAQIGLEFDEGARSSLPTGAPPTYATEFVLDTPQQMAATPFTGVSVFYTQGHPPGLFDVPHYHPIYYIAPAADRAQIRFNGDPGATPPPAAVPAGYLSEHFVLPGLGDIYADPNNPWFLTSTFVGTDYEYAFYNGKMSSINLTIAQVWLTLHGSTTVPLAQPQTYPTSGYYPTTYTAEYDPNTHKYRFYLGNFVKR